MHLHACCFNIRGWSFLEVNYTLISSLKLAEQMSSPLPFSLIEGVQL